PENAARVRSRLDKAESRALVVLVQNEPLLRQMADALNQARMLEDDALKNWLDQITVQPNGLATPQTNSLG
ncbi:hypothetical protein, partial [Oceaniovalibus sp. ACAM 378]|uniref:hypothetical protein n=1 Tax=Oceaniovalibus sp. ACAM 378 TaxID=2599923 RepID=UPI001CA33ABC